MASAYGDTIEDEPGRENANERDRRVDRQYTFDRAAMGCEGMSVLAIVTRHAEELAAEFCSWWSMLPPPRGDWREAMPRWEHWRFGAELFRTARGVIAFHVRGRIAPDKARAGSW